MAVKIFIKRKGVEDHIIALTALLKKMRTLTIEQHGYIFGETLRRIDQPDECLVISTWRSKADWDDWFNNDERKTIQDEIDRLLGHETHYEIYEE